MDATMYILKFLEYDSYSTLIYLMMKYALYIIN